MLLKTADYRGIVGVAGAGTRIDDDIDRRQLMLVQAERFANQSLDPVAPHRVADDARCNRQPQPGSGTVVASRENREHTVGGAPRLTIDAVEFGFCLETLSRSERAGGSLQSCLAIC